MKYIKKELKNEPSDLKEYRNTTENASYEGFSNRKNLQLALLKEQGYICAYCNKRIGLELNENFKPQIEIEHYKSQEKSKLNQDKDDLNYRNMLGVCNGNSNGTKHCDKSRNYLVNGKTHSIEFKILNPTKKNLSENLISYSLTGEIKSKTNNEDVEHDLKILNLNNKYLIDYRKDALDKARLQFEKENPRKANKRWTTEMFDKEIEKYKSKHLNNIDNELKYKPFCQYIIWYFEDVLKQNPKYSTKE